MKSCPQCGRENEEHAWLCDCGYEFGDERPAVVKTGTPPREAARPLNPQGTAMLVGLCALGAIIGGMLLPAYPAPADAIYPAAAVLSFTGILFFWTIVRIVGHAAHGIGMLFSRGKKSRDVSLLLFHAACLTAAAMLMGDAFLWFGPWSALSPNRTRNQLKFDLADRIPINHPNGPKTYDAVMRYLGAGKLTPYERGFVQMALIEVIKRAQAARDVDVLCALWESDDRMVKNRAGSAIANARPSAKTLSIFADALNNDGDRDKQHDAIYLLYESAVRLDFELEGMPTCPGIDLFNKSPDYYVHVWRYWWETHEAEMLSKAGDGSDN